MKCFSLFSGIGGFDLALRNLGHTIVGACEIDKYARSIYSKRFPDIPIWEDARAITPDNLPDFDILCAGFPCQAFSLAGKRLGFEDTRGTLFYEIARIAEKKRPQYLFLENVKGLLYHDNGKTFQKIIATFDAMGYNVEWQVINSKFFVPQNRERIYIIGHLRNGSVRPIFPLGEVSQLNDGSCQEAQGKGQRIRGTTIDSNYSKGEGSRTMILTAHTQANIKQRIQDRKNTWTLDTSGKKQGIIIVSNSDKDSCRIYSDQGISRTLRANSGGYGSKTGAYQVNQRIRMLTPTECERLQGFPDGWTEGLSNTQRYKCLGNAVTVPVIEHILSNFQEIQN